MSFPNFSPHFQGINISKTLRLNDLAVSGTSVLLRNIAVTTEGLLITGFLELLGCAKIIGDPALCSGSSVLEVINSNPVPGGTVIQTSAGSVATPAYSFVGDADTGMSSSAANIVEFSVGGVETLQITATGLRVGPSAANAFLTASSTGTTVGTAANVLPLIRASVTPANNWEDGYFGNSAAMVFSPTDFTGDIPLRPTNITRYTDGARAFYASQNANVGNGYVTAKVIPKGFSITENSNLFIWAQQNGGASFAGRIAIQSQSLVNGALLTNVVFPPAGSPMVEDDTVTPHVFSLSLVGAPNLPIIGDGITILCLEFTPSVALTLAGGVSGGLITMERV